MGAMNSEAIMLWLNTKGAEFGLKVHAAIAVWIIGVLLNIVLILALFDIFGVQTTSFAALLAGAGLAIGTA